MEKNKVIIVLQGSSNIGKSSTIRKFAQIVLNNNTFFSHISKCKIINSLNNFDNVNTKETYGFIDDIKTEKRIGFFSYGDPGTEIQKNIECLLNDFYCDIVVCACRTKGETVKQIKSLKNVNILWTTTYNYTLNEQDIQMHLNQVKAEQLYSLIKGSKWFL